LQIENHSDETINVVFKKYADDREHEVSINPGEPAKTLLEIRDLPPEVLAAEYRIREP
jgi:hypothetical protein